MIIKILFLTLFIHFALTDSFDTFKAEMEQKVLGLAN